MVSIVWVWHNTKGIFHHTLWELRINLVCTDWWLDQSSSFFSFVFQATRLTHGDSDRQQTARDAPCFRRNAGCREPPPQRADGAAEQAVLWRPHQHPVHLRKASLSHLTGAHCVYADIVMRKYYVGAWSHCAFVPPMLFNGNVAVCYHLQISAKK